MEIVHVVDVLAIIRVCMEIVYRLYDFGGELYFIIRVRDEVRCIFVCVLRERSSIVGVTIHLLRLVTKQYNFI